jgi:hypothetical protein
VPEAARRPGTPFLNNMISRMKYLVLPGVAWLLQGCTLLAVADAAGSAVVYGVKTAVNVVDAVTPDIINKKKD